MFGLVDLPFIIENETLNLQIKFDDGKIIYYRKLHDDVVEKRICPKDKWSLLINPVEPTNIPKNIAQYLLIEFDKPIVVAPKSDCTIFLTFPVETGIFIASHKISQLIDIFSLVPQKYTLYGEPNGGIICKYWKSEVYLTELPEVSLLEKGIVMLKITNDTINWTEISKTVFYSYNMIIYFNNEKVVMKAKMKITDKEVAETRFDKEPYEKGMHRSIELYNYSKLNLTHSSFIMEYGL